MGYSFTNIQLKSKGKTIDVNQVLEALIDGRKLIKAETEDEADIVIAIHPGKDRGWVTVVSDLFDQDDEETIECARILSEALQTEAIAIGCFDSDYLFMNLLDVHSSVDAWAACGHFPLLSPRRSNFSAWKHYVPDVAAFRKAMHDRYVFAEECLKEAESILALPAEQSMQSVITATEEAGFICYRYKQEEKEAASDPPRFELCSRWPVKFYFGNPNIVGFLNHGGPSKGVGVMIGGEPFDTHKAEIERVELQFHGPKGEWVFLPVEMQERIFEHDDKGFYGACPSIRIPKAIPEGLPWKKRMEMEFNHSINVRFYLRRGYRQDEPCGSIQVSLIPLENKAGQAGIVLPL